MQAEDFTRFKSVMTGMAKLYERDLDKLLLDAYWLALKSWSLQDFEQAAGRLTATSKFMPRPADFNELREAGRETAGEAWALVLDAVRHSGYSAGISQLIDRAVQACGGYRAIGQTTDDGLPFIERRFAEHFKTMQDAEDAREAVPQIAYGEEKPRLNGPKSINQIIAEIVGKPGQFRPPQAT